MVNRLEQQLAFLCEIDKLKSILRKSRIFDGTREETSAEHSWHLAMLAGWLHEYAREPVDPFHSVKLALVHDIVEIDAGDTFIYDKTRQQDRLERETRAAERIFALLPEDQRRDMWALWHEFEAGRTPEARFVRALDRIQPMLLHAMTGCRVWFENGVTRSQVLERIKEIERHIPALWPVALEIVDRAVREGMLANS
jgi:putative hydrolase of HD superfamily